ncbi:MAG: zinc-binding dehydrogenase [Oscillospiraceae bacterium]|nr:zinc-binding dehydrogenase [Oscillospiraceae bacterium]
MKTKALRLYGKKDLRLEEFELPPIKKDELLVKIIVDSLCMSSYKAACQAGDHKRVPDDVATNPTIIGHEFCGEIIEVGESIKDQYKTGDKFSIQPSMKGTYSATGYTFAHLGGNAQYGIIPACYAKEDNVLHYDGDAYFSAALAEPLSCVIGAVHANYHTTQGVYVHTMDIKKGGKMALLAGAGPMGLGLIDYVIHRDHKPSLLVVTDIDDERLGRASAILSAEEAAKNGVTLKYVNTKTEDPVAKLKALSDGHGFDDAFVFAPVAPVIEQADAILAYDGCLNFFAGPTDTGFQAKFNFYDVHYNATHIAGTSGGNTDDMREALRMSGEGKLNPAILITHIGGLDSAKYATLNMPDIPGGKKMIYTHISMPLTAISDFGEKGKTDPMFRRLHEICAGNNGLWSAEAEKYLLENAPAI